jgi:hypothetical protein
MNSKNLLVLNSVDINSDFIIMLKIKYLILSSLMLSANSFSQDLVAIVGQSNKISFPILNVTNSSKCHIEVLMPNQQKIGIDVSGPEFIASLDYMPTQQGMNIFRWEGKLKSRGLNSVFACPGSGSIQVQVNGNSEQIAKKWEEYFAKSTEEVRECVKYGMDAANLKYQIFADPGVILTGPDDSKIKPIYEKCDSFMRQNQPNKGVSCTLANQNNVRTTCDGVYAERQPDGRLRTISRLAAIQLHFEGKPWTVGLVENVEVRNNRLKREEEERQKLAAEAVAKREAEEKEKRFRESPEYKKQQAELERKRLADEKEAEIKAKKAQEERERQRIVEEKQARDRAQQEKAAADARRLQFSKDFPFYAVITCGEHFPVHACFSKTELELRNGNEYKMYKLIDIMMIPQNQNGIVFNLRNKFELKMQNSDDMLILNLKIYNRATDALVFEKSAARFGVIRISN